MEKHKNTSKTSPPGEWIEQFYKPQLDVTKVAIKPAPLDFRVSSNDPDRIKNIYERVHWTAWLEEKAREEEKKNGKDKEVQTEPLPKLDDLLLRPEPALIRNDFIWNSTEMHQLREAFQQTRDEYRQLRAHCVLLHAANGTLKQQLQQTQSELTKHDAAFKEKRKEMERLLVAKREYEKMIYVLNHSIGAFRSDLAQSHEDGKEWRRALHMKCLEMQHVSVESMQLQEETKKHFIFIENEAKKHHHSAEEQVRVRRRVVEDKVQPASAAMRIRASPSRLISTRLRSPASPLQPNIHA